MEKSDHMRSIDLKVDQVYYGCFQEVWPPRMCNKILEGDKEKNGIHRKSCTNLATWGWDQGDIMFNFDEFPKSRYAIFLSCYTCVPNMVSCWAACLVLTLRLRVKVFAFRKNMKPIYTPDFSIRLLFEQDTSTLDILLFELGPHHFKQRNQSQLFYSVGPTPKVH